jgi:hypothetical protein
MAISCQQHNALRKDPQKEKEKQSAPQKSS